MDENSQSLEMPPLPRLPPPLPKPRVWTALLVGAGAILASVIVSSLVMVVALFAKGGISRLAGKSDLADIVSGPDMLLALFVPGQAVFLLAAFGAAKLSPHSPTFRLGFVRSKLPWWTLIAFVLAVPLSGFVGDQLITRLAGGYGEQLQLINDIVQNQSGAMAVVLFLFLTIVPAFVEETLFRGYIQRRLLERWHPAAAIAASTLLFACAHVDPHHALAVLPMGVWFGVVAWRCGAVWPAMLCHAAQNITGVIAMRAGEADQPTDFSDPATIAVLAVTGAAFAASVLLMKRFARPKLA